MATPESVRSAFVEAAAAPDKSGPLLLKAHHALMQMVDGVGLDLLVLDAETALQVGELDAAEEALSVYTLQSKRYSLTGESMATVELKDQFVCRAAFARGLLLAERARPLKGPDLVSAVLAAIKAVLEGVSTAQANERHTFLTYNGSVHYWHVSRPLQRDGLRGALVPSLETVLKALEKVPGQEEWRCRNLMNLALCQMEAGNAAGALATATSAADMAKASVPPLVVATLGLKAHLQNSPVGGERPKTPPGGGKAPPPAAPAKKGAPPAASKSFSDHPTTSALITAQMLRTGASANPDPATTEKSLQDAWARLDPAAAAHEAGPLSVKNIDLGAVAELAWAAALSACPAMAAELAARALQSPLLPPRLRAQLTQEYLTISQVSARLTADNVRVRLLCLQRLEPVLAAFVRLEDAEAIQDAARLIWNAGLPLLQSNLRTKIARPFAAATAALDAIGSGLHRLRASLHLELAGAYLAEDLLAKASAQVARGLALDYAAPPEEVQWTGLPRPLDRFLAPLRRALALRGNIYSEPDEVEDQAVLFVEKAKEAADTKVRANYLNQAIVRLTALPNIDTGPALSVPSTPAAEPATDAAPAAGDKKARAKTPPGGGKKPTAADGAAAATEEAGPELVSRRVAAKHRLMLWADIAKAARASGLYSLVHRVAPYVLRASSGDAAGKGLDREIVQTKAEVAFMDAEACIMMLQAAGVVLLPPPAVGWPEPPADAPAPVPGSAAEAEEWQRRASGGFQEGVRLGASAGQAWLVMNGAVYLWNHWLPAVVAYQYSSLVPLLKPVVMALLDLPDVDAAVLYPLAHALACGLEHRFMEARAGGPADYKSLLQATSAVAVDAAGKESPDLALGVDVCRRTASRAQPHQRRRMVATLARLLTLQGTPVARLEDAKGLDPEPAGQAVALVELLPKPEVPAARKREALAAATALLAGVTPPDVELWAKLAKGALALGEPAKAMECAQAALALVPPGTELSGEDGAAAAAALGAEQWYWLAIAAAACGQGTVALIAPGTQTASTVDALRRKALGFFVSAVRYGSLAVRRDLVDWAMRLWWNTATPCMASSVTRPALYEDLEELVARMLEVGVGDGAARGGADEPAVSAVASGGDGLGILNSRMASQQLLAASYALMLDCLADQGRYADGCALIEAAFQQLPRPFHKALWEFKVTFLTRMGRVATLRDELTAIREYSPELQAKVWRALADATPSKYDAMCSHLAAVDAVSHQPLHHAEALLELADFMLRAHLPLADVQDAIITAVEEVASEEEPATPNRLSSPEPSDSSIRGPTSGGSFRKTQSRVSSRPTSRMPSRAPSPTRGGPAKDWAPEPSATSVSTNTSVVGAFGCRHLRVLVRAYLMMAKAATNTRYRADYVRMAHHATARMVRAALAAALVAGADAEAEAAAAAAAPVAPEAGGTVPPVPEASSASAIGVASDAARAAALASLPDGLEGWISFRPSTELLAALKADKGIDALTPENVGRPELLLSHLDYLADQLVEAGMDLHLLPVLQLAQLVGAVTLDAPYVASIYALRSATLLDRLGCAAEAAAAETQAGPLLLSEAERKKWEDEVDQRVAIRRRVNTLSSGRRTTVFNGNAGGRRASRFTATIQAAVRRASVNGLASAGLATGHVGGSSARMLVPLAIRHAWLARAEFLTARGQVQEARVLLKEAKFHAATFGDGALEARCLLMLARASFLSNDVDGAINYCFRAANLGGELSLWRELIPDWAQYECASRDGRMAARDGLEAAAAAMRALARTDPPAAAEAAMVEALLLQQLAALQTGDAAALQRTGASAAEVNRLHAMAADTHGVAIAQLNASGAPARRRAEAFARKAEALQAASGHSTDHRPHLLAVRGALMAAHEHCIEALSLARPAQLGGEGVYPNLGVQRMLAQIKARMALLELDIALAAEAAAPADRAAQRETFPQVAGADAAAVNCFLDSSKGPLPAVPKEHEERAVLLASAAVNLAPPPTRRTLMLRTLGLALLRQHERAALDAGAVSVWKPLRRPRRFDATTPHRRPSVLGAINARPVSKTGKKPPSGWQPSPPPKAKSPTGSRPPSATGGPKRPTSALLKVGLVVGTRPDTAHGEDDSAALTPILYETPYLRQVQNALAEALAVGLADDDYEQAGAAAEDLATLWGRSDALRAAHKLLLAQSCKVRGVLRSIYLDAAGDGETDKLLLNQRAYAATQLVATPLPDAVEVGGSPDLWAMLSCTAPTEEIVGKLTRDTRLLSLHTSTDGRWLYLAGLWPGGAEELPPVTPAEEPGAIVDRMPINAADLAAVLAAAADYQRLADKHLLNARPSAAQAAQAALGEARQYYLDAEMTEAWKALLAAMESLLMPFQHVVKPLVDLVDAEGFTVGRKTLLLLDPALAPLPLEAWSALAGAASVARDFSVHVLGQRLASVPPAEADLKANFAYLVDLRCEDREPLPPETRLPPGRKAPALLTAFQKSVLDYYGKAWAGLKGSLETIPGEGEIQRLLTRARCAMYFGLGKFLAYVPPPSICGLQLRGLQFALLLDRVSNERADRRQSYLDNRKLPEELHLERPYATAALLSLRGVRTVALNTLASTVEANVYFATRLAKAMGLANGLTLGEAVRMAALVESDAELPPGGMPPYSAVNVVLYGLTHAKVAADDGRPPSGKGAAKQDAKGGKPDPKKPEPAKKK